MQVSYVIFFLRGDIMKTNTFEISSTQLLEKLKSYTSKWYFGGIMYVALILGFILSQLVYYDLKKSKNKNNE